VTDRSLTLSAPAKINLYLGVHTERDDRGYHRVDSLMVAVGLSDTVTVTPAGKFTGNLPILDICTKLFN